MGYRKRKKNASGFENYCRAELTRVKKARHAGSRSKAAKVYQVCLARKNVKTGLSSKEVKKIRKTKK